MHAPGARSMARRFVAGETVADGIAAARALADAGFMVSLDCLGESVKSREEARAASDTYVALLEKMAAEKLADGSTLKDRASVSLKLTQMGQDITHESGYDEAFLRSNLARVLDTAAQHDIFVRFDMESSAYTQRTIDFFKSLWDAGQRNIGIVLQSYMRRTADDATLANQLGARVRLCKGAYKEPADVAFQEKSIVDANYVDVMKSLLSDGNYPGIATHDEAMIRATREWAREKSIPNSAFEFQMLYGIRRDLQHQLLREGYNVRVYVPFGAAWYPYLMRRMAERPANLFFIVNAVFRESPFGGLLRKRQP
jgi:proline dehydrogenase